MSAIESKEVVERVLLRGISWSTYEALLHELEGARRLRLTYDRGDLEIISPLKRHEQWKRLIGRLIEALTEELGIPIQCAGSTTWKSELKARGLEADECYYVQNEPAVRGETEGDLQTDPPPDLAIEVEVTKSALDRLAVYASLGVPEIWRYDGARLTVHAPGEDAAYREVPRSRAFPFLPIPVVMEFMARARTMDETSWIRAFRSWVRENLRV